VFEQPGGDAIRVFEEEECGKRGGLNRHDGMGEG
jgi:hypothetical protein